MRSINPLDMAIAEAKLQQPCLIIREVGKWKITKDLPKAEPTGFFEVSNDTLYRWTTYREAIRSI